MALTKQQILEGVDYVEEVKIEALGDEVNLRPLSFTEEKQVEARTLRGVDIDTSSQAEAQEAIEQLKDEGVDVDSLSDRELGEKITELGKGFNPTGKSLQKIMENEQEAKCMVVAFGLSCKGEKWTPEEAGKLPRPAIFEISEKVWKITDSRNEVDKSDSDADDPTKTPSKN